MISVIIPTCDRNDLLVKCLDCLSADIQHIDRYLYEIIVTDDGSSNDSKDLIRNNYPLVKWVEGPKKGPAANRNNAVKFANGNWLLFLDDDCIPSDNLITSYLNYSSSFPNGFVFEGAILSNEIKCRLDEVAPLNLNGGKLWSCNFMISKHLFLSLSGFNESFPYACMEDVEFADRIKNITKVLFCKDAYVIHPFRLVKDPKLFYKKSFLSHKIYFNINKSIKKKFKLNNYGFAIFKSILFYTIPDIIRFRGKGILYVLYYHLLQIRILFYCMFK